MKRIGAVALAIAIGAVAGCGGPIHPPDHWAERACREAPSCVLVYSGGELIGSFANTAYQVLAPGLIGVQDGTGGQMIISGDFIVSQRDAGAGR